MIFSWIRIRIKRAALSESAFKKQLDPDPVPDLHWKKQLDPSPQYMNVDPHSTALKRSHQNLSLFFRFDQVLPPPDHLPHRVQDLCCCHLHLRAQQ